MGVDMKLEDLPYEQGVIYLRSRERRRNGSKCPKWLVLATVFLLYRLRFRQDSLCPCMQHAKVGFIKKKPGLCLNFTPCRS